MSCKIAVGLGLIVALMGCAGTDEVGGVKVVPQDINVSPRSPEAYDPALRELEQGTEKPGEAKEKPKNEQ